MNSISPITNNGCGFRELAASHFTGEVSDPEFLAHAEHCASCKEVGSVLRRLHSLTEPEPSANLTAKIMAAIQQPEPKIIRPHFYRWAAAAAVVTGLASTGAWMIGTKSRDALAQQSATPAGVTVTATVPKADQSLEKALDWFCRTQEADGSWNATRWGGDLRFEVALTALPMLAILSAEADMTPQRKETIAKAQRFLESACDSYGHFGPRFYGSGYNQGIATLAMLSCYKHQPEPDSKRLLDNALAVIVTRQNEAGWWGASNTPQPNLSISLWQVEALKLAANLGWTEVQPYLTPAMKWVETHATSAAAAPGAIDSSGDVDYFNAYFTTTRLKEVNDESSRHRLASIRDALRHQQTDEGTDSGSWTPDDRWGRVGGRLYTTALASLALR